jgi:glycosyltransferase involved in cell wall biosynthesis
LILFIIYYLLPFDILSDYFNLQELKSHASNLGLCYMDNNDSSNSNNTASGSIGGGISGAVDVVFRTSISTQERLELLRCATALLYTPDNEHFGIVPLEAMNEGCPVVAVASGGPKETVSSGETGFLCAQTAESFCAAMLLSMLPLSVDGSLSSDCCRGQPIIPLSTALGMMGKIRVKVSYIFIS